jgi:hypothetical protein
MMDAGMLIGFAAGVIAGVAIGRGIAVTTAGWPGNARPMRNVTVGLALHQVEPATNAARNQSSLLNSSGSAPVVAKPSSPARVGVVAVPDAPVLEGHGQPIRSTGLDLDAMTDTLWEELHGSVDRLVIGQVLTEIVPRYREARIMTFVPIFVRRDALAILRGRG